jgi:LysM repeat protein
MTTTAVSTSLAVPMSRPVSANRVAARRDGAMRPAAPTGARRDSAGPRAAAPAPVRLTRRGRVVVFAVLVLLAVAAVSTVAVASSASPAGSARPPATMVVGAGDTLWTVATEVDPDGDPRATIAELRRLNGLNGSNIEAGQELILPAR